MCVGAMKHKLCDFVDSTSELKALIVVLEVSLYNIKQMVKFMLVMKNCQLKKSHFSLPKMTLIANKIL